MQMHGTCFVQGKCEAIVPDSPMRYAVEKLGFCGTDGCVV